MKSNKPFIYGNDRENQLLCILKQFTSNQMLIEENFWTQSEARNKSIDMDELFNHPFSIDTNSCMGRE
jgi:hypothetical protein